MAAAARLGAFGFSDKARCTLYSSIPLRSIREKPDTDEDLNQPLVRPGKGYGISLTSSETACARFKMRKEMLRRRLLICDWSVFVAITGLILAILDVELHLIWENSSEIMTADTGHCAMDFGITRIRRFQIAIELCICSICPLPGNFEIPWPILRSDMSTIKTSRIPLYVILTVPMFFRLYLLGRYVVLHSYMIRDPATRAIASLNRISVDFAFVLKTMIYDMPLTVVIVTALTFWLSMSWMMTQCERYAIENVFSNSHYFLDYAWFEAVTFFAIGYGDITVETYCGRALALFTGLVGAVISSIITVLIGRKLLLSLSERRVNQVIAESQLSSISMPLLASYSALGGCVYGKDDMKQVTKMAEK